MSIPHESAASTPAPLRAADWRFLLPLNPGETVGHLALVGGVAGAVERAASLGLATRISHGLPSPGGADVVVAAADAAEPIDRIASAVARDGVLYLEVDRRRRGRAATTPGRVAAVLAAARLSLATIYAVEPDLVEPRAFVPVDTPGALAWYRAMFGRELGPAGPLIDLGRRSGPGAAMSRARALRERFVVVATSAARGRRAGPLRHPDVARLAGTLAAAESSVMLTHGGDRVILLPFARDASRPVAVVKVPKSPLFVSRTENEQAAMRALRARLAPSLASAIPEPLGVAHAAGLSVACERYVPGHSVAKRAHSRVVRRSAKFGDLRRAMEWLAEFHRATLVRRLAPADEARRRVVEQPLLAYDRELGATPEEARLFTRVGAAGADPAAGELPIVCQHRDYTAWNLLRHRDELAVLDWEGAREGPALADALHLATTWLYTLRLGAGSDDEVRCVRDLFVVRTRRDPSVSAARSALDDYMTALAIDRALLPPLVVHQRVELAVRRREQRRLQNELGAHPGREVVEVEAVRMLAAEADRLFAGVSAGA